MKNRLSIQLGVILITITTFLGAFYFFSLKPKLVLPKQLLETEKIIATTYLNLLQNRLGIVGLATLDPNTSNLGNEKDFLLSQAIKTNKEGLKNLQSPPFVRKLEKDSGISLQSLFEENKRVLEGQKALLEQLKSLDSANSNLFKYKPLLDLASLDLADPDEREQVLTRTKNAINGLAKIEKDLEDLTSFKYVEELRTKLAETQILMKQQMTEIESRDYKTASLTFLEVYNRFSEMRELGLDGEKTLIHAPESIQLITDQTNLLLKYEFLLERINKMQEALPKTDFFSIF